MANPKWASAQDAPLLAALNETIFGDYWTADQWRQQLKKRNRVAYFLQVEGKPVDFLLYSWHAHCLRLQRIAVSHEYRRRGVGRRLVRKLMQRVSDQKRVVEAIVPGESISSIVPAGLRLSLDGTAEGVSIQKTGAP